MQEIPIAMSVTMAPPPPPPQQTPLSSSSTSCQHHQLDTNMLPNPQTSSYLVDSTTYNYSFLVQ